MSVDAKLVKELRDKTGAGMMDCKQALVKSSGDLDKAVDFLRISGIAKAEKKVSRVAKEGIVYSYIHQGNRLGVLLEIGCETDFVAKTEDFKTFVKDICLHIAAANPVCISREEVPGESIEKEREIATSQIQNKPAHIIEKIVEGKLDKYYQGVCLLEQPFVKNPDQTVQELLTEKIAKLGENMIIRRFARYQLGD